MTNYEYPEEAADLIRRVSDLGLEAAEVEQRVAQQLEHVREVQNSEHAERTQKEVRHRQGIGTASTRGIPQM